jgi:nicotinamidase-related amidase
MVDLCELVRPEHTVVVTQECQEGVLGEHPSLPALAEVAREQGAVDAMAALVHEARAAGVQVVHCTVEKRADLRGSNRNARLFMAAARAPVRLLAGSPQAAVIAAIGVGEDDLLLPRMHGLSPMTGTQLDAVLRHLGCKTVVAVGVSLNVAITNLVFDAVNRGYQVVVPRDAVVGTPADYARALLDNTLSLIATVTTGDDVVRCWKR